MESCIKVVISGACGRMGREIVKAVTDAEGMKVVGAVDVVLVGEDIGTVVGISELGIKVESDLSFVLKRTGADVLIDFTTAGICEKNLKEAIDNNVRFVTGTTNMDPKVLDDLISLANSKKLGGVWAANFAIGAVLMMKFSKLAAKYMPSCEIIELHHDKKIDAPSGTAKVTAQQIVEARQSKPNLLDSTSKARGLVVDNVPIHSVRLSGYVASQEVLFGGQGQVLSIRHDSIGRDSFMPGIVLGVREAMQSDHVIIGLESLLS